MKRSHVLALVVVLGLLVAACGNADDDEASSSDTTTTAPAEDGSGEDDDEADDRDTFVPIEGVPGVTDEAITFGAVGTRSNNPLGTCILDCYTAGIKAYFDHRNAEGGIYGRQLVLDQVVDDALTDNQVRSLALSTDDEVFGVFSATLVPTGWADLDSAGVPTFVWNIHASDYANRPNLFGHLAAACPECVQRGLPYLVREAGASKVAVLGYGVSQASKSCAGSLRNTIETFADGIGGAEVVYFNDDLAFGLPNGAGPEVTAIGAAGADFVATCMDLNGMETLAQELERQGLGDVVMSHPNTYDQAFVAEAGGLFEGDFVTPQFQPFEAESGSELQAAFVEQMEANGEPLSELAMVGFINADTAFTGLLEAGPEFDRAKVVAALNALTEYTAGGLIAPIDWTTAHIPPTPEKLHPGRTCFAPVRVVDGEFETVADPSTPFLCWDNDVEGWAEPEELSFIE